jgi:hypothetical protein
VLLQRGDNRSHVLVEVHAELLGAGADLVAIDRCGEARLLELLLDRLGRQAADALRADLRARHDEARELVDRVQRLLHERLARHAEVIGVGGHSADELRRVVQPLELGKGHARMTRRHVRIALVVEVVQEARLAPQLLVLAAVSCLVAHRRLDSEAVPSQRLRLDPRGQQVPGGVAGGERRHGC